MELATALHHSAQRPGKKVVEEPEEEEVHVTHDALRGLKTLPPQVVAVVPWPPQLGTVRVAPPFAEVPSLALPSLGDDAGHDVTSTQFLLRCALAQRERERGRRRQRLSFSRKAPAPTVQWRASGSWMSLATPSSSTTVSLGCRVSRSSTSTITSPSAVDIVDDAPYCELKLRGQSSCYWLEPSGSRHRLTFASKDFCAKFNEVFDEAKRLSRGGAG